MYLNSIHYLEKGQMPNSREFWNSREKEVMSCYYLLAQVMEQNLLEPRNWVAGAYFPQYSHFSKFAFLSSSSETQRCTPFDYLNWNKSHIKIPHSAALLRADSKHFFEATKQLAWGEAEASLIRSPRYWTELCTSPVSIFSLNKK